MIRLLDIFFSLIGILILMPVFLVISILIKFYSPGPVFYKQLRVGINGKDFFLLKFRTMYVNADQKGLLTVGGRDPRVSSIGYYLRNYKLDELPQLFNVLVGEMSLVGPRPEVRKYVDLYTYQQAKVLNVRPGITDWASIKYRDENEILANATDPEYTYIEIVMPEKIKLNMIYIDKPNIGHYIKIIFATFFRILK